MGCGMYVFGLCLLVYGVVTMALAVWGVARFKGVMVVGLFSCRRVCDRGEGFFKVLGCIVVGVVIAKGGILVIEYGLLLSR